jgi:hypothetical protein
MIYPNLILHLSQAHKAILKTQNNHYSDKAKQAYQDELVSLFFSIEKEIVSNSDISEIECFEFKNHLDFIFKNIEFLDSSILNLIPYEILECLKAALNDWIDGSSFILTTSLINNIGGFSFDPSLITFYNELYKIFEAKYSIIFNKKLIQINIPKAFSRDYLVSVVHYHELAHFVDTHYKLTDALSESVFEKLKNGDFDNNIEFKGYFDFLENDSINEYNKKKILINHFAEYFSDLFASQYIGKFLSNYLNYITENQHQGSVTHPSSIKRKLVVSDYLDNNNNLIVNFLNEALNETINKTLEIRYEDVDEEDFNNLLPVEISSDKQLHGLIQCGWRIWNLGLENFQKIANVSELSHVKFYSIINNLIEKSIGNYIISKTWNQSLP